MKSPIVYFVIVLLIALAASVGYGTWYSAVTQEGMKVADLESQILAENQNVDRIATARAGLAEISGDEANVQNYFVPESGVVAFIDYLESQGTIEKSSVSVLSVSTAGSTSEPTLLIALSVKGTFDEVMRTVGAIEYAPYAVSIGTLSVEQDGKGAWHADLTLSVGSVPLSAASTSTNS